MEKERYVSWWALTKQPHEFSDFLIEELMATIPQGHENAIKRSELCLLMDLPDRTMRHLIENARLEGCYICNQQDGRGYYLADCEADIDRQKCQGYARAVSILAQNKYFNKVKTEEERRDQWETFQMLLG